MFHKITAPSLGSVVLLIAAAVAGQTAKPPASQITSAKQPQAAAPELRPLTGDDEKRARQLAEQIEQAATADRWDEAVARAEELLALRERIQGPKHFETVSAQWRLKALRRVAPMPHDDRVAYQSARTLARQAKTLWSQGKYAQAQPLFEKSLEIDRRLLTDDHPDTAARYNDLAVNLNSQGKYAQAQPLYEKALEIRRRLLGDDHPDTALGYNSVAHNLDANGKHAAAQPLFEKALEMRRRLLGDDHPNTVTSYNNLAANLNRQGRYAQAQPLFEKALEIRRRLLGANHRETALSDNNLAFNLASQGKYAEAQPLYLEALTIHRRLLGDDHPDTATSYNNLASNVKSQGNYTQAQPLYEKALEIRRRVLGEDHPQTATSYNNLALNLKRQGKFAQAQPLYEKALQIDRHVFSDDHPHTADTYNNLAVNLRSQGKYAAAQPLYERAVEINRRLLGDDHPRTGAKYNNLAGNLNAQGKYTEARDCWLRAVKSLDAARLQVAFTGLDRAATEDSARIGLAAVLARLGQPAEAWQPLEEDLGRGLLDELAARSDRRLTPTEQARLRELTAALERLDRLVEVNPGRLNQAGRARRFAELHAQRQRASIALGEFQTRLVQDHGPLAGQVAKLADIQAALPAEAALVAWVDIAPRGPNAADPDGEHWGVVVRSRGIPAWVKLAGTGPNGHWTRDDARLAGRVRTGLQSRPDAGTRTRTGTGSGSGDLPPLLARLRSQRLEPLAKALSATNDGLPPAARLIILPSREMAGVPLEALLAADDTRTVSYSPSATVFKYLREQPRPSPHAGLLALGDPVCLPPLPGTRYEVEALTWLFRSDGRPTRALLAAQASEPELDRLAASGELGQFSFIHLATHGLIDEAIPQRSAVILSQTGLPDPLLQVLRQQPVFDGMLTVREIQRSWDLKAELVALSACETALGREAGGEGFVGFTQALLMSGARSVCLSLWKVDDRSTSLLMTRFYQNLLGKRPALSKPMPKAEALSEAKRWLRSLTAEQIDGALAALERGDVRPLAKDSGATSGNAASAPKSTGNRPYGHPYFWAAFVLVGDPD